MFKMIHQTFLKFEYLLDEKSKVVDSNSIFKYNLFSLPRGAFFCILWNICWGGGGQNGSKLKLFSFFEMLKDSGCKFKLN